MFHSDRNGRNFSYRYTNRYQNIPRSISGQISGCFGPFQSFRKILANFGRDANSGRYRIQPDIKKKKKKGKGENNAGLNPASQPTSSSSSSPFCIHRLVDWSFFLLFSIVLYCLECVGCFQSLLLMSNFSFSEPIT